MSGAARLIIAALAGLLTGTGAPGYAAPSETTYTVAESTYIAPADSSAAQAPVDEAPAMLPPRGDLPAANGLVYLVPEMAESTWRIAPGPKHYAHRLSFSPAYGTLGKNELYAFRFAYNPNAWLGWEAGVAHNPGKSVHALLHTFSAVLRYPIPWRIQPYVTGGYGMLMVFPGESINADPVTDNALVVGGGLELYVREDLAIRAELKQATVFGGVKGKNETVTYGYREATIGFAFYRTLGGADASDERP